jgi:hypothetical protein
MIRRMFILFCVMSALLLGGLGAAPVRAAAAPDVYDYCEGYGNGTEFGCNVEGGDPFYCKNLGDAAYCECLRSNGIGSGMVIEGRCF